MLFLLLVAATAHAVPVQAPARLYRGIYSVRRPTNHKELKPNMRFRTRTTARVATSDILIERVESK